MDKLDKYLSVSLRDLPGVGPKTLKLLYALKCYSFFDLLLHFPSRFVIKKFDPENLNRMEEGEHVAVPVSIKKILKKEGKNFRKQITTIQCYTRLDEDLELIFFNYFPAYIFNNLKLDDEIIVSGKLSKNLAGICQLMHPKIYRTFSEVKKLDVVYPLVSGISSVQINKIVMSCIKMLDEAERIEEWLDEELIDRKHWSGFVESIKAIHNPENEENLQKIENFRERIAFDELLANQLAIRISRNKHSCKEGSALSFSGKLADKVLKSTGMTLTSGQAIALKDIKEDQLSSRKMVRLLQGDVGSGKTLVAILAALNVVEAGYQVAMMVPTDILSRQHFNLISFLLTKFGITVKLLTGATTKSKRKEILGKLISGEVNILIGTHALFQDDVKFKSLRLVVIDEQHRFGVQQRLSLMNKNKECDVLAMSATPIPRTLSLIMYGDMDISVIKDKPVGRLPIRTITALDSKIDLIINLIKQIKDYTFTKKN